MISLHPIFLFALIASVSINSNALSLCRKKEITYFSCKVKEKNKIVSLCGNSLSDSDKFWLQYRFGSNHHIEFIYPLSKDTLYSEAGFSIGHYQRDNGFDTEVNFKSGGLSYTVFSWVPGESKNTNKYGVFIATKRSEHGTRYYCAATPIGVDKNWHSLGQQKGLDE